MQTMQSWKSHAKRRLKSGKIEKKSLQKLKNNIDAS